MKLISIGVKKTKHYQEALQNIEIIMQEWIETAQELGRKIPEPTQRLMSA
jgi:predicted RNase H-like HicB family nuclease